MPSLFRVFCGKKRDTPPKFITQLRKTDVEKRGKRNIFIFCALGLIWQFGVGFNFRGGASKEKSYFLAKIAQLLCVFKLFYFLKTAGRGSKPTPKNR